MEKIAELINHCYSQIQKKVEGILADTSKSKEFLPSQNLEAFATWAAQLQGSDNEKAIKSFAGLSPFFDSGVLLLRENDRGIPQHFFVDGDLAQVPELNTTSVPLPQLDDFQIKRRPGKELYEEIFKKKSADKELSALIIGTPTAFVYLVFSKLPHPWLHDQVGHLQSCLMRGFTEKSSD